MTATAPNHAPLLRDILPRLHADISRFLAHDRPDLINQLDQLTVISRCACDPECANFTCGFRGMTEPLESGPAVYTQVEGSAASVYYGLSGKRLTGLEVTADYPDLYIRKQLAEHKVAAEE